MCADMSAQKSYIAGERVTFTVADEGFAAVNLHYAGRIHSMSKANGEMVWTATIETADLVGSYNWAAFADGSVAASGTFTVRPLVSKYRAVIDAIDAAMAKCGANGKMTVSVGEISLTDKTFDELQKFRAYYLALAEGQEAGTAPNLGPTRSDIIFM